MGYLDSDGDYLVVESNSVEKITANGSSFNDGDFPAANILNGGPQMNALDDSGFVMCGTTSDRVRTFLKILELRLMKLNQGLLEQQTLMII